jgi:putative colanic acid biosynthesis acetyltransferase WcaF
MQDQTAFDLSSVRSPHSWANKIGRVLWAAVWTLLFRPSPRLCRGWRRCLLRLFGARIGWGVSVDNTVRIWAPWNLRIGDYSAIGHHCDCYSLAVLSIGRHSIVSQYSFLCTGSHDYTQARYPVTSAPIHVGDGVWIAADVFVGPGVAIGDGAVVGARSSVFRDVEAGCIVAGNPARVVKRRDTAAGMTGAS